jgi:hypothetical protein
MLSGFPTTVHQSFCAMLHRISLLVLFLAAFQVSAGAQSILVSEALAIRTDYGYELVGRLRDRILLFRDKYDEFEVQAFDNQMQLSWSRKMDDLDRRGVQIITVVGGKNDFAVIHKLRRKGEYQLRIHRYDPGANLIDSMVLKDYGERMFQPPVLEVLRSEDRNCFVVFNVADRTRIEMTCFRIDKMEVLWDKTIQMPDYYYDSKVRSMTLSNEGDFFLIAEQNNRKAKNPEHRLEVFYLNKENELIKQVPLNEFASGDMRFTYDNLNKHLVGAGFYAEKNRDRSNGVFFVRYQPGGEPFLHYEPFDEQFLSVLRRKDQASDGGGSDKGISDSYIQQIILRQDGGAVLVCERYHEIQRGTTSGRGFWRDGMRMVVDFYHEDIFLIGLHPDGIAHWKTVVHKKQYSQDDEATFSSYFLFRGKDKLRVLFNDEIKYENTCSEYAISPVGDFDRNGIINTMGQDLRLRFRDGLQISANECLIPSEFRNKLKLVLVKY